MELNIVIVIVYLLAMLAFGWLGEIAHQEQ